MGRKGVDEMVIISNGTKSILCILLIGVMLLTNFITNQSVYASQPNDFGNIETCSSYQIENIQRSFSPPVNGDIWYFDELKKDWVFRKMSSIYNINATNDNFIIDDAILQYNSLFEPETWITSCRINNKSYLCGLDINTGGCNWAYPFTGGEIYISLEKERVKIIENFSNRNTMKDQKLVKMGNSLYWAFLLDDINSTVILSNLWSGETCFMNDLFNLEQSNNNITNEARAPTSTLIGTSTDPIVPLFQQINSWCEGYSTTMILYYWKYIYSGANGEDQLASELMATAQGQDPPLIIRGAYQGSMAFAIEDTFPSINVWHGDMKSISNSDYSDDMSDGEFNDLKACIFRGWPVLINVDTNLEIETGGVVDKHAVVITGYNTEGVYVNDPSGAWLGSSGACADAYVSYETLEAHWNFQMDDYDFPTIGDTGTPDKHTHTRSGLVMYPGDGSSLMNHPEIETSLSQVPEIIEKNTPFTTYFSIENKDGINNKDMDSSGIEIIITNGEIIGITPESTLNQHKIFNLDGTLKDLFPSQVVQLGISELKTSETAIGGLEIIAYNNPLIINYRGYSINYNEQIHTNYDFTLQNPWDEKKFTFNVWDDRTYEPEENPLVDIPEIGYLRINDPPTPLTGRGNIITKPCHPAHQIPVLDDVPEIIVNTPTFSPSPDWDGWFRIDPGDLTLDVDFHKCGVSQLNNAKYKIVQFGGHSTDWIDIFTEPCDEFTQDWIIPRSLFIDAYGYIEIWIFTTSGASEFVMVELKIDFNPPSGPIYINEDSPQTEVRNIEIDLSFITAGTTLDQMRFANENTYEEQWYSRYQIIQSPHPVYPGDTMSINLDYMDATQMKVHFEKIDIRTFDHIFIKNSKGDILEDITGPHPYGVEWASTEADGDVNWIEIQMVINNINSWNGYGFKIDYYSYYTPKWSPWESFSTSKSWTLSEGFGEKTVYCQVSDIAGNIYETDDSIQYTEYWSTLTINNNALYTPSNIVNLQMSSQIPVTQMRFSNSESNSWFLKSNLDIQNPRDYWWHLENISPAIVQESYSGSVSRQWILPTPPTQAGYWRLNFAYLNLASTDTLKIQFWDGMNLMWRDLYTYSGYIPGPFNSIDISYRTTRLSFFSPSFSTGGNGFAVCSYEWKVNNNLYYSDDYEGMWIISGDPNTQKVGLFFSTINIGANDKLSVYHQDGTVLEVIIGPITLNNYLMEGENNGNIVVRLVSLNPDTRGWGIKISGKYYYDRVWTDALPWSSTYNNWDLLSYGGTTGDGIKSVYCQVKDALDNIVISMDVILLDTFATVPTISSRTHPDQESWYANNDPTITLLSNDPAGIIRYYFVLDGYPTTTPTTLSSSTALGSLSFTNLTEGIWYMHAISEDTLGHISIPSHYRLKIDVSCPTTTLINPINGWATTSRQPVFTWSGIDALSGFTGTSQIQVSTSDTFTPLIINIEVTTSLYATTINLMDSRYYWRVKTKDVAGNWGSYTDERLFVIDNIKPTSSVLPMPATQNTLSFWVSWTGSDDLSGVKYYSAEYKEEATGIWTKWILTPSLSAKFTGKDGHIYYFRCNAIDNAGNIENIHEESGDAFTTIACTQFGIVEGHIFKKDTEIPVPETKVQLKIGVGGTTPEVRETFTDNDGYYSFTNIPVSRILVTAWYNNLNKMAWTDVLDSGTSHLDIYVPWKANFMIKGQVLSTTGDPIDSFGAYGVVWGQDDNVYYGTFPADTWIQLPIGKTYDIIVHVYHTSWGLLGSASTTVTLLWDYQVMPTVTIYFTPYLDPSPSCPYVYAWNGTAQVLQNSILESSIDNDFVLDSLVLNKTLSYENGEAMISIDEKEQNEHTDIDSVHLLQVNAASELQFGTNIDGSTATFFDTMSPNFGIDGNGTDVLHLLNETDGIAYNGFTDSEVIVSFNISGILRPRLVICADALCPPTNIIHEISTGPIDIQVLNSYGEWQYVASFWPHDLWSNFIIEIGDYIDPTNANITVKLTWLAQHFVDFIGLDISGESTPLEIMRILPMTAVFSNGTDCTSLLQHTDGLSLGLDYGQQVFMTFPIDENSCSIFTTFILEVNGKYTVIKHPCAKLSVNKTEILTYESVMFNATNSIAVPGTEITEYFFDFGDGINTGWINSPIITHEYLDGDAQYGAFVLVKDSNGIISVNKNDSFQIVNVQNRPPTANIDMYNNVTLSLTISGRKDNKVTIQIYEDGELIQSQEIMRTPGPPNTINFSMNKYPDREYSIELVYDAAHSGANPTWLTFNSGYKYMTFFKDFKTQNGFHQTETVPGCYLNSIVKDNPSF